MEHLSWDISVHQDLEVFTDTLLCYMKNWTEVTVDKHIRVYPNQNPWMTREVQRLLKERNTVFSRSIRRAKAGFRRRIWAATTVQHLTNFRSGLGRRRLTGRELNLQSHGTAVPPPTAHSDFSLSVEEPEARRLRTRAEALGSLPGPYSLLFHPEILLCSPSAQKIIHYQPQ